MILPIYTDPNPILTTPTTLIDEVTPELRTLVADMHETMKGALGVGLAAPQVGHSLAVCIIELVEEEPEDSIPFMALLNPRITWKSPVKVSMIEACLSIPGVEGPVRRPAKVRVKARDLEGNKIELSASGMLARILQHEIDHLNGRLFTCYVPAGKLTKRPTPDYPRL